MKTDFDVAIVGYGPVGAMTALQLADAGVSVVLVDRGTEILDIPRAVGIDGESMRSFQRLGMAEEVEAIVQPRRETEELYFTDSKRQRLFGMELARLGVDWKVRHAGSLRCDVSKTQHTSRMPDLQGLPLPESLPLSAPRSWCRASARCESP